jgi:cytochrome c556
MISKSRVVLIAMFALTAVAVGPARSRPQEKKAPPKNEERLAIMKKKLPQAHKLIDGLALQDFDMLKSAADELAALRLQAAWMAENTLEYQQLSIDFQRNIEATQRAATEKNIDAASLAYIQMTMTCVKCHKHIRELNQQPKNP